MKKTATRFFMLSLFALLVFKPLSINSWNDTGHMVIGAIAWENMTETTQKAVMNILMNAPDDSDMLDLYNEEDEKAAKVYFMKVNYWADVVRDRDERARWEKYHKGPWHYIGTYWKQTPDGPVDAEGFLDDENVVERIEYFRNTLSTEANSDFHEAVEVAWITHLVGDIHMPLHNTSRVTEETPDGDRGGNSFDLGEGWPWNLHAFWDGIIDVAEGQKENESEYEFIFNRADKIMALHPKETFDGLEKLQDATTWNEEGQQITRAYVYPPELKQDEKPGAEYTAMAHKIAQKRMALSGYRMAEFFNAIYDPQN